MHILTHQPEKRGSFQIDAMVDFIRYSTAQCFTWAQRGWFLSLAASGTLFDPRPDAGPFSSTAHERCHGAPGPSVDLVSFWVGAQMSVGQTNEIPFWGRCTTHFRTSFSVDWDVHLGYDLGFDPWPNRVTARTDFLFTQPTSEYPKQTITSILGLSFWFSYFCLLGAPLRKHPWSWGSKPYFG